MGIIRAFEGAITSTFADQWKDIITAPDFDELTAISPGIRKSNAAVNAFASEGVISKGSKIFIPENTAAIIFNQAGIETILTTPGGYEYTEGQENIFSEKEIVQPLISEIKKRIPYSGISEMQKYIAFVNLREIRNIKFGTRGAMLYHDKFYGTDLEIMAYGSFSILIADPIKFVKNYVPANVLYYSFADQESKGQLFSEFLQSFMDALNTLSESYRISQLPSQANELSRTILDDETGVGSWEERFGIKLIKVGIENIKLSQDSSNVIKAYNQKKMEVSAYEDVSQKASNISAQQNISSGVKEHGLGDVGGALFGMNMAQGAAPLAMMTSASPTETPETTTKDSQPAPAEDLDKAGNSSAMSFDEKVNALKKLKELLDAGILTQEEFDAQKKLIL